MHQVPERRLLVESDCADEKSAALALPLALRLVADARGWTLERAARTTTGGAAGGATMAGGAKTWPGSVSRTGGHGGVADTDGCAGIGGRIGAMGAVSVEGVGVREVNR